MHFFRNFQLFPKDQGKFAALWLINLIFPIYALLQEPMGKALIGFMLLAVFVLIYRQGFWTSHYLIYYVVIHMVIIMLFTIYYHPMYLYIGFYMLSLVGMIKELRTMIILVLGIAVMIGFIFYVQDLYVISMMTTNLLPPVFSMLVLPFIIHSANQKRDLMHQLSVANQQIELLVKRQERQRIARDLHDTLGHTLSLITFKSELAEKLMPRDMDRAILEVRDIQSTSRSILKQVRELVSEMNLVKLDEEVMHVQSLLTAAQINVQWKGSFNAAVLDQLRENILSMCLRESVTNIVKHSQASECVLEWKETPGQIILTVADNGAGFEANQSMGNGLLGIKERLNLIGGFCSIDSNYGKGTKLELRVTRVLKEREESWHD
jgi:two-component system sensor histidine kinase DesK